jgi:hypothetical protein
MRKEDGMKNISLVFIIVLSVFFAVSCGPSNDLSGEYDCIKHYSEELVGKVSLELNKDGTVVMNPINHKGTYKIDGDTVTLELEHFDLTFTREGGKLISSDETIVYEKK